MWDFDPVRKAPQQRPVSVSVEQALQSAGIKWVFIEMNIAPAKTAELAALVKSAPGFEFWEPDKSPESLESLGRWFAQKLGCGNSGISEAEQLG